jgi:hypothetical protein
VAQHHPQQFGQFIADEKAESPFDRAADLLTNWAKRRNCAK